MEIFVLLSITDRSSGRADGKKKAINWPDADSVSVGVALITR